jgi:WhiB family redox-sensing transcriptional regulator
VADSLSSLKSALCLVEVLRMTSVAMSLASEHDPESDDALNNISPFVVELLRRPRWQTLAECRGERVEMFIPDRGGPSARAKQMCARCPVKTECLRFALAIPDLVGYWAGTNERERRRLRAQRRRTLRERDAG